MERRNAEGGACCSCSMSGKVGDSGCEIESVESQCEGVWEMLT